MISTPTAPVTPTTPILRGLSALSMLSACWSDLRLIWRSSAVGDTAWRVTVDGDFAPALKASEPPHRQLRASMTELRMDSDQEEERP